MFDLEKLLADKKKVPAAKVDLAKCLASNAFSRRDLFEYTFFEENVAYEPPSTDLTIIERSIEQILRQFAHL